MLSWIAYRYTSCLLCELVRNTVQGKMQILTVCALVLCICSVQINSVNCEEVHVDGKIHRKEILAKNIDRPYQLSYEKHKHRVYFSYNVGTEEEDRFNIGYIDKGEKEHKIHDKIENGFAIAIDNSNDRIYFGGSQGIYMESLKEHNDTKKIVDGYNIWDMFFKKELHFIRYPQQRLYKCVHNDSKIIVERQKHIHEKVFQYAIDGHHDSFITNRTGLYLIKNGTTDRHLITGPVNFRCVEINNKGVAFFCGQHAIYTVDKEKRALKEVANIRNIFGLTFDNEDNIIYSNPHEIVKLLPEKCK